MPTSEGAPPAIGGWIAGVPVAEATGRLAEVYAGQQAAIGRVTELTQIGGLYPDLVAARLHLYEVVDATPSAVPPWLRTSVALLTSVLNGCLFCTVGNTDKLVAAGHADAAAAIKDDPEGFRTGDEPADAVLDYVRVLVTTPRAIAEDHVQRLRDAGWSDIDILDVNNLAAYYGYINRVAHGLGLQREA